MGNQMIKIKELVKDEEIYPRTQIDWIVAYSYANQMKSGARFPPIFVGIFEGKKYLIDGYHRVEAYKRLHKPYITAEVKRFSSKRDMYIEAVKRNATHGKSFSTYDKTAIAIKLKDFQVQPLEISRILGIKVGNLSKFVGDRVAYSTSGKEVPLREAVYSMAGRTVSDKFIEDTENMVLSQEVILDELISLIEHRQLKLNTKRIKEKVKKLKELLSRY